MARVIYGSIVTELRGKLGGHIFSKSGTGYFMSTFKKAVNTSSVSSLAAKSAMFNVASAWSALNVGQRTAWKNVAMVTTFYNSMGTAYTPTGYQLFSFINDRIIRSGSPAIVASTPANVITTNTPPPVSVVFATNTLNFGFNPVAVANSKYFIYALEPCQVQYLGSSPQWRLIAYGASFSQADTTIVPILKNFYYNKFKVGNYLPLMVMSQNTVTGAITRLGLPSLTVIS